MELPYRWNGTEGRVLVEVRVNDDPAALGCAEFARGFPYCTATVEHAGVGYLDVLGWVQLANSSKREGGFYLDYFEPLGPLPHPLCLYGWAPTLFEAPHSDEHDDWDIHDHSFLSAHGGELLEFRHEVRPILGFSWGFYQRSQGIEHFGPAPLSPPDWDRHRDCLSERFGKWNWTFAPGFSQDPLQP